MREWNAGDSALALSLLLCLALFCPSRVRAQTGQRVPPAAAPAKSPEPASGTPAMKPGKGTEKEASDGEEGGEEETEGEEGELASTTPSARGGRNKKKRGTSKERATGWSPVLYGRLSSGYDTNVSLNEFQKQGNAPASAFMRLHASTGAWFEGEEVTAEITYQASQMFYFQQSSLDQMGHAAKASLSWERGRFELSASFETEFQWFTNSFRFYGIEHELALGGTLWLGGSWWMSLRYGFGYYDVRDSTYQPLNGHHHGIRVGPEYRFGDVGRVGVRYVLDVTRLGIDVTQLRGRNATPGEVAVPLSYDGHGGTLYGSYWPHDEIQLSAEAGASRRLFPEVSSTFTGPRGTRTLARPREDTVVDLSATASWSFWKALSTDLSVSYRISDSNFEGQRFTGSYRQFVVTAGLTYYN